MRQWTEQVLEHSRAKTTSPAIGHAVFFSVLTSRGDPES